MGRKERLARRTAGKIRKGKISSPTISSRNTSNKKSVPKDMSPNIKEGKQIKEKKSSNNKKTKTGRGIIKEQVTVGDSPNRQNEAGKARDRSKTTLDKKGFSNEGKVMKEEEKIQKNKEQAAFLETTEGKGQQILKESKENMIAKDKEAHAAEQKKVETLRVINKWLITGIITLATMGIGLYVAGGAAGATGAARVAAGAARTRGALGIGKTAAKGASKFAQHGTLMSSTETGLIRGSFNRALTSPKTLSGLNKAGNVGLKRLFAGGSKKFITKKALIKGGIALAGTDAMMAWLASDNILTGAVMYANNVGDAVTFGQLSPQEGLKLIEELEETANSASNFVKISSRVNPTLWFFGKPLMINANQSKKTLEFQKSQIQKQLEGGRE